MFFCISRPASQVFLSKMFIPGCPFGSQKLSNCVSWLLFSLTPLLPLSSACRSRLFVRFHRLFRFILLYIHEFSFKFIILHHFAVFVGETWWKLSIFIVFLCSLGHPPRGVRRVKIVLGAGNNWTIAFLGFQSFKCSFTYLIHVVLFFLVSIFRQVNLPS